MKTVHSVMVFIVLIKNIKAGVLWTSPADRCDGEATRFSTAWSSNGVVNCSRIAPSSETRLGSSITAFSTCIAPGCDGTWQEYQGCDSISCKLACCAVECAGNDRTCGNMVVKADCELKLAATRDRGKSWLCLEEALNIDLPCTGKYKVCDTGTSYQSFVQYGGNNYFCDDSTCPGYQKMRLTDDVKKRWVCASDKCEVPGLNWRKDDDNHWICGSASCRKVEFHSLKNRYYCEANPETCLDEDLVPCYLLENAGNKVEYSGWCCENPNINHATYYMLACGMIASFTLYCLYRKKVQNLKKSIKEESNLCTDYLS